MPTPLELLLEPLSWIVFAIFGALALAAFAVHCLRSSYLPLLWAEPLAPLQLFDLSAWPTAAAVAAGLLVPAQAATIVLLTVTFLAIFQHANVRTPRWLGYFVQRPEMHTVHHARGIHHDNDADLLVFELLFGTFRNPAAQEI